MSHRLSNERFPRSSKYCPEWILENGYGANPQWLAEWLCAEMDLQAGMRVLDIGCGRAKSSLFLAKEFGVQVWATDLWVQSSENWLRIKDAGEEHAVFPIHADARTLPFAAEFFDAIVAMDSYQYFGTDDGYLNYLIQFVKPGRRIGIASAGLMKGFDGPIPEHLARLWTPGAWTIHTFDWWRYHWDRTGLVDVKLTDAMAGGCQHWLQWATACADCADWYSEMLAKDQGEYLGYVRVVARRKTDVILDEHCWPNTLRSLPITYEKKPLLASETRAHRKPRGELRMVSPAFFQWWINPIAMVLVLLAGSGSVLTAGSRRQSR